MANATRVARDALIERVSIAGPRMTVRPAKPLRRFMPRDFEVSYDPAVDLAAMPDQVRLLPFLWQVAPIVWATDSVFEVDVLDPRVAESFEAVRNELRQMYPSINWNGEIRARALIRSPDPARSPLRLAALFSGGVDSTWTAIKHRGTNLLLITVWGTHVAPRDRTSWAKVAAKNRSFAEAHAGGFATVRANLKELNYLQLRTISPEVAHWWTLVQHAMAYTGVTAPLLYQHGIDTLHIAAAFTAARPGGAWGSNPALDEKISLGHARVHHDSYDIGRQEKVARIVSFSRETGARPVELRVCLDAINSKGGNCGRCYKCVRTMLGVALAGGDPVALGFPLYGPELLAQIPRDFAAQRYRLSQIYLWQDLQRSLPPASVGEDPIWTWLRDFDFDRYRDELPARRGPSRSRRVALGARFGRLYGVARGASQWRRRLSG